MRGKTLILGLLLALTAIAQEPARGSYEDLLARFKAMPGLEAEFREEKRFALLDAPLVSEGTLHFLPPGKLARHTRAPTKSTVLIDGDTLAFGDERGKTELDLKQKPVVRLFVDAFVKLFAGDRPALDRMFTVEHEAKPDDAWSLVLRPKLSPMKETIERLELAGHGLVLERMRLLEVGGDETITTYSRVDAERRYAADEVARVFRLPETK
jgi:outer membrane lipoprotein-sorting protein